MDRRAPAVSDRRPVCYRPRVFGTGLELLLQHGEHIHVDWRETMSLSSHDSAVFQDIVTRLQDEDSSVGRAGGVAARGPTRTSRPPPQRPGGARQCMRPLPVRARFPRDDQRNRASRGRLLDTARVDLRRHRPRTRQAASPVNRPPRPKRLTPRGTGCRLRCFLAQARSDLEPGSRQRKG